MRVKKCHLTVLVNVLLGDIVRAVERIVDKISLLKSLSAFNFVIKSLFCTSSNC